MNIVRICKDSYGLVFDGETIPVRVALKVNFERAQEGKKPRVKDISTLDDFHKALSIQKAHDKDTINGWLSSGDFKENQVFIILDDWEELGSFDKGYEMARDLLKTVGSIKPFNLRFVSMFKQEQLMNMVKKENKIMVKTFPHLCLTDLNVLIKPEAYSTIHFRLIRDIAVSDKGRLAAIRHDVKNIIINKSTDGDWQEQSKNYKQHALRILDDLDCKAYHDCYPDCQKRIAELHDLAEKMTQENTAEGLASTSLMLQNGIYQLIDEVASRLLDTESKEHTAKEDYQVLIIDDETKQRKELFQFFSKRYKHVLCNDMLDILDDESTNIPEAIRSLTLKDPKSALQWVNNPKNLQDFDIIVLDLLYKDQLTDAWLPFDGLDLLRRIRTNSPYSTIRIITSLPRNEISVILGEEGIDLPMNHIFTKGNGWSQLEGCLYDRKDEIDKECKNNARIRDFEKGMRGPRTGFFDIPAVRRMIAELRSEPADGVSKFAVCFENARKMLDPSATDFNTRGSIQLVSHHGEIKYDEKLLTCYLAHRIAFIQWAANKFPDQPRGIDVSDYGIELERLHIKKADKNGKMNIGGPYFSSICFSRSTSSLLKINLNPLDLFPEELELYKNISRTNSQSTIENESVKDWVYFVVNYACNDVIDVNDAFRAIVNNPCVNYNNLKQLFNTCIRLTGPLSTLPEKDKGEVENFVSSVFSEEAFDAWLMLSCYNEVIEALEKNGIITNISEYSINRESR